VIFDNQLRHATTIIETYKGEMPLHTWLKDFFRANKQMGARDRRTLSTLVYGYYRLGHSLAATPTPDRLLAGLFLCTNQPGDLLQHFHPELNEKVTLPLEEKMAFFQTQPSGAAFRITDIFPWPDQLSEAIDHHAFCLSFLRQPDLFLRIRPGHEKTVLQKLDTVLTEKLDTVLTASPATSLPATAVPATSLHATSAPATPVPATSLPGSESRPYQFIPPFTLRLPNGFKVEEYFTPDREIVIQDYSSQQIASFFPYPSTYLLVSKNFSPKRELLSPQSPSAPQPPSVPQSHPSPQSFWDACAASGGKSILAHDLYPAMAITVSDIRESILRNLQKRFQQAGIKKYQSFIADLTKDPSPSSPPSSPPARSPQIPRPADFDLILVDAPCTGSGTWSRTPEDLYFFDPKKISHYIEIQKKILGHIAKSLTPGSCLIYSTCSVFKKENEEIVAFLRENFGLNQDRMENITGYDQQADTMFAARLSH
jgi:16S rRNA (cytosine967-C5)-methyltransferase